MQFQVWNRIIWTGLDRHVFFSFLLKSKEKEIAKTINQTDSTRESDQDRPVRFSPISDFIGPNPDSRVEPAQPENRSPLFAT